jgi:hypothetical protein
MLIERLDVGYRPLSGQISACVDSTPALLKPYTRACGMPRVWVCHARPILTRLAPTCSASSSPATFASTLAVTTCWAGGKRVMAVLSEPQPYNVSRGQPEQVS